jgi:hypothetical protein
MDLLFGAIDALDSVGVNEEVDLVTPELVVEGVEQEQAAVFLLSRLPRLSKMIAFLDGKLDITTVYYDTVPAQIDWKDGKSIQEAVPLLSGCGTRQVPQCLLLDADTAVDKLVVANWWRGLTKEGQLTEIEGLKRVYRTFTSSNEKLINDHWENMRNSIESRPAAAAIIDDTSNVYVGTADTLELRNAGMECTVSARVSFGLQSRSHQPVDSPSHAYPRLYPLQRGWPIPHLDHDLSDESFRSPVGSLAHTFRG